MFFLHYCIGISWKHFFIKYWFFFAEYDRGESSKSRLWRMCFKTKESSLQTQRYISISNCVFFFFLFFFLGSPLMDWAGRHGPLKDNSCVAYLFIWALISKIPMCIPHLLCKCRTTGQEFGAPYPSGVHISSDMFSNLTN